MKSICVPTSVQAMSRLDVDACVDGDLVTIELSESEFHALQNSGLFSAFNAALGLMIDEFEDENIAPGLIDRAIAIYEKCIDQLKTSKETTTQLRDALELARAKNTGVFFYF